MTLKRKSERQDLNLRPPQPHCEHMASISLQFKTFTNKENFDMILPKTFDMKA